MSTKVAPPQHQSYIVVTEIPGHSLTVNGTGGPTILKEEIPQDTDALVPNSESDSEVAQIGAFKTAFTKFWWLMPLLGIVLAIGGVSIMRLQGNSEGSQATATQIAPLPVQVTPARSGPIQAWASSEGTVQAARFKRLTFDTSGDITYIIRRDGRPLRAGDRVRQGEQLARIDDRNLLADVNKAQAGIYEARQQKAANAANVAQAQTQVAQARPESSATV